MARMNQSQLWQLETLASPMRCSASARTRSGASLIRDPPRLGARSGPGSGAHRYATQSSLRRLRKLVCAAARCAGPRTRDLLFRLRRLFRLLRGLFRPALERRSDGISESGARIGGAVLGDRLLFLRDFERLDRDL